MAILNCRLEFILIFIGSYEVVFYDGFKKVIQPINIKVMDPEVQEEVR